MHSTNSQIDVQQKCLEDSFGVLCKECPRTRRLASGSSLPAPFAPWNAYDSIITAQGASPWLLVARTEHDEEERLVAPQKHCAYVLAKELAEDLDTEVAVYCLVDIERPT